MEKKRFITWKKILFLLALLGVGLLVVFIRSNGKTKRTVVSPQYKDLQRVVEISGVVDADQRASLRFLAGGKIVYVGAKEGDWVKKWQTIASIDKKDLQKNLQKDLNDYMTTRYTFEQTNDDYKDIQADKEVDRLREKNQLTLNNAVLDVELQDVVIKNASLYAPFDGILVTSPARTAGVILAATDVFEIVNPETMHMDADVDEADIAQVYPGQKVTILFDAYPEEAVTSAIESISFKSSQTTNGTVYKVRLTIPGPNDSLKYRLGMNGTARIVIEEKDHVLSIPASTLTESDGKKTVDVQKADQTIEKREVTTGLESDDDIEIISGLSEQDKVLLP